MECDAHHPRQLDHSPFLGDMFAGCVSHNISSEGIASDVGVELLTLTGRPTASLYKLHSYAPQPCRVSLL
jgi:hypothetical protein